MGALGRGPDFRPEEDSIVRVQAARLRKHLKKYYETDGARHPVQIRIPPTGYKPEFVYVQREHSGAVSASPDAEGNGGTARRGRFDPWVGGSGPHVGEMARSSPEAHLDA